MSFGAVSACFDESKSSLSSVSSNTAISKHPAFFVLAVFCFPHDEEPVFLVVGIRVESLILVTHRGLFYLDL